MIRSDVDVLVIGSGIGGLCAAGLCARAGREVLVLEAHHQPGGAAHGFQRQGYHFESGPSLWSGLGRWPSSNPLAQVLRALGQTVEVIPYRSWDVLLPEGDLRIAVGHDDFEAVVRSLRGPEVAAEWRRFVEALQPIAAAADALPLLALRPGVDGMAQLLKRGGRLLPHLAAMRHLSGSFGPLVDRHLSDPFLRHWVDLLSFLISGMPMGDTNAAAMATLFGEWFEPDAHLDYPVGGSAAVVEALVRGLKAHGGSLHTGNGGAAAAGGGGSCGGCDVGRWNADCGAAGDLQCRHLVHPCSAAGVRGAEVAASASGHAGLQRLPASASGL